jgi:hypothetical protein
MQDAQANFSPSTRGMFVYVGGRLAVVAPGAGGRSDDGARWVKLKQKKDGRRRRQLQRPDEGTRKWRQVKPEVYRCKRRGYLCQC